MKRIIKAIPWGLLARLGFKGLSLVFVAILAALVFVGKTIGVICEIVFLDSDDSKLQNEESEWELFDKSNYQHRPDLAPFRPE